MGGEWGEGPGEHRGPHILGWWESPEKAMLPARVLTVRKRLEPRRAVFVNSGVWAVDR